MDYASIIQEVADEVRPHLGKGKVADYIPALSTADHNAFGIAVTTVDGDVFHAGDAGQDFTIQSISKVFTFTLALAHAGDELWHRLGREPSGSPFNSLVQLEREDGIPRNPFINAGALAVTDVVLSSCGGRRAIDVIVDFIRQRAGAPGIQVDAEVAESERRCSARNAALVHFISSFGNLENDPNTVLDIYCEQCAIAMNCISLSRAMLYLATAGHDPLTDTRVIPPSLARRINAVMLTCGHYDASGDFAYRVGLPGKSGVAGGIAAIVPGTLAIAVWSPGLNPQGNSLVGTLALEKFAAKAGTTVF